MRVNLTQAQAEALVSATRPGKGNTAEWSLGRIETLERAIMKIELAMVQESIGLHMLTEEARSGRATKYTIEVQHNDGSRGQSIEKDDQDEAYRSFLQMLMILNAGAKVTLFGNLEKMASCIVAEHPRPERWTEASEERVPPRTNGAGA